MSDERESEQDIAENPAKMLKIALGYATFDNKDLGGAVFALVDSMVDDYISGGFTNSDTTDSLTSDLLTVIKSENEEIEGRLLDADEDDDDELDVDDDDDDFIIEKDDLDEDDDDDDDDDEIEDHPVLEDDDDDDLPIATVESENDPTQQLR